MFESASNMPDIRSLRVRASAPTLNFSQQKRWLAELLVLSRTDFESRIEADILAEILNFLAARMWERDDLHPSIRKKLHAVLAKETFPLYTLSLETSTVAWNPSITAISPDGKYLVAGNYYSSAKLFSIETGQIIREFSCDVTSLSFSPDGRYLLIANGETAHLWDIATGEDLRQFSGHTYAIFDLKISTDGRFIVTCTCGGSPDPTARLWDLMTGEELLQISDHQNGGIFSVSFSRDNKYIMTGHQSFTRLWDRATGKYIHQIEFLEYGSNFDSIEFSNNGKYILTSNYLTALLWDADTLEILRKFTCGEIISNSLFSSDDQSILTVSSNGTRLWNVATGQFVQAFHWPTDYITSGALSQNNKYVVTGSNCGSIRLWQVSVKLT